MNSLERIMTAVNGTENDKRPTILTLSLYGARLTNCPLNEYYTNPVHYIAGQTAIRETFSPDALLAPFTLPLLGSSFGGQLTWFDDFPPTLTQNAFSDPGKFSASDLPDIDSHPYFIYLRDCIKGLAAQSQGQSPVAAITLSPVDLPSLIFGIETWLNTMLFDQHTAHKVIDICTSFFIELTSKLFADGAAFIVLPIPFANLNIITKKILTDTAIPNLKTAFAQCPGPLILHHVGISIQDTLPYLTGLPNTIGCCVGADDDLSFCRHALGDSTVLLGNIDGPGLVSLSPDQIYQNTMNILANRKDDKHFILASSAADIDLDTPPDNIEAIFQAVNDYSLGLQHA